MERYKNLGGDSGVRAYEIGFDSVTVQFQHGGTYVYNNQKPGTQYVEKMKTLAISGHGLNSFINSNPVVKQNYHAKLSY
jgi:hypothetical protein